MVFLKDFFKGLILKNNRRQQNVLKNYLACQKLNFFFFWMLGKILFVVFVICKYTRCSLYLIAEGKPEPDRYFIPVPVPVYVPTPLAMYTTPTPVMIPVPIPVPVPVFIPTTKKSSGSILKQIKVNYPQKTEPMKFLVRLAKTLISLDIKKSYQGLAHA